jgi:hypothetical protein
VRSPIPQASVLGRRSTNEFSRCLAIGDVVKVGSNEFL